nr:RNA-directed DNA polymerase, eukaryota [Tanacetum cinerariifolium]
MVPIKSTRLFIDDYLLPTVGAPTRWVSEVPIKTNILAWKVSLDKLPTRLNLSLRGIEIPSISCSICSSVGVSCSHLLFSCNMARDVIFKVARWWELDLPVLFSYEDWLDWFRILRFPKASMARRIYFRGGLGVGSFYRSYGGSKRNGSAPLHFCKANGDIARHILQQLKSINIVDFHSKGVYGDCHTAMKYISVAMGRELVVKDSN